MGWWSAILRAVGLVNEPSALPREGAQVGQPVAQGYDVHASMTAFSQFPWVRACLDAIGTDLSGLPLRIVRGFGDQAEVVDDPALRALLERPTTWQTREEWESSLVAQLLLSGNAYALQVGAGRPSSLPMLHCERVRVIPGPFGGPEGYEYQNGGGDTTGYAASAIIQWRLTPWEQGAQGLLGEGLIRALQADLNADLNAARLAAKTARQGRPSAIFSPASEGDMWDADARQQIAEAYRRIVEEARPAMVLSSGVKAEFPSFTPRDLEFSEQRALTRETVLAAFGVPPTRVGLPTANYATSREQSSVYWNRLMGLARLLDAGLTAVARRFDPSYSVRHDFSGVDALQEARSSRLDRVSTWVLLGADAAAAAAYEGFDDAPVSGAAATQAQAQAASVGGGGRVLPMHRGATVQPDLAVWLGGAHARALDPDQPDLEDSAYERPPYAYVAALKEQYPEIWGAGGNERGNEAFEYWTKYQGGDRSEGVLAWVREREAWAARHFEDGDAFTGSDPESPTLSNIGGVVAWLKWGVVGQLGWARMRDLIEALKDTLDLQQEGEDGHEAAAVALWRGWLDEVHTPSEKALAIALRRALRQQAEAIARQISAIDTRSVRRDMLDALLAAIFPDSVRSILAEIAKNALSAAVRVAWGRAAREVGQSLNKGAADALASSLMQRMAGQVNATTSDTILSILRDGLADGATINQIQGQIIDATAFSPSRALAIARTETTRCTSAAASGAWQQASDDEGLVIRRRWLAARDGSTREAHRALDGQEVALGEFFVVPAAGGEFAGAKGTGPGEFLQAGMCVNCRCTVIPVVTRTDQ
jgi:HK97 family phage portal protein